MGLIVSMFAAALLMPYTTSMAIHVRSTEGRFSGKAGS